MAPGKRKMERSPRGIPRVQAKAILEFAIFLLPLQQIASVHRKGYAGYKASLLRE